MIETIIAEEGEDRYVLDAAHALLTVRLLIGDSSPLYIYMCHVHCSVLQIFVRVLSIYEPVARPEFVYGVFA